MQNNIADWFGANLIPLISAIAALLAVVATIYNAERQGQRDKERQKAESERQEAESKRQEAESGRQEAARRQQANINQMLAIYKSMGSESIEARTQAVISLDTFLEEPYFRQKIFSRVVSFLRIREVPSVNPKPNRYERGLIEVFLASVKAVPRDERLVSSEHSTFDASGIRLDSAELAKADLSNVWMRGAYFNGARLLRADLSGANLSRTDFKNADLTEIELTGADLTGADLTGADLTRADLTRADLRGANLTETTLTEINLNKARYNTKRILANNAGRGEHIGPTQWPHGFKPEDSGAECIDC